MEWLGFMMCLQPSDQYIHLNQILQGGQGSFKYIQFMAKALCLVQAEEVWVCSQHQKWAFLEPSQFLPPSLSLF